MFTPIDNINLMGPETIDTTKMKISQANDAGALSKGRVHILIHIV